ncbi:MAG TPA: CPBP family intramembrane glutamic endopeptidase [Actinomycetota bacterium]|nr:CPBP family intramembrane glutamic endopeptidase [Actinomycetota bacterium]
MTPARMFRRQEAAVAFTLLGATALLLARPYVTPAPTVRLWSFAAGYVAIGLAALAVPTPEDRTRPLPAGLALAAGAVGLAAASLAAGPSAPVPWGPGALPVAILAAVAEEALFRRAAYGRLARFGPGVAVIGTAVAFGLVHLPAYGVAALPVDLGAGLLFSWQRWASGTWLVPAATHAAANLLVVLA